MALSEPSRTESLFLRLKLENQAGRLKERLIQSVESRIEAPNRARKPKTSAFKWILG